MAVGHPPIGSVKLKRMVAGRRAKLACCCLVECKCRRLLRGDVRLLAQGVLQLLPSPQQPRVRQSEWSVSVLERSAIGNVIRNERKESRGGGKQRLQLQAGIGGMHEEKPKQDSGQLEVLPTGHTQDRKKEKANLHMVLIQQKVAPALARGREKDMHMRIRAVYHHHPLVLHPMMLCQTPNHNEPTLVV